jgi:phospholipase/lecithinase/hemolysin
MVTIIPPRQVLTALLFAFALTGVATAGTFSSIVVYGDSLSDNGNLFAVSGQPGPPYFDGRRSNGPVAVEQLAASLGIPLVDYAWIGATTGIGNYADGGNVTTSGTFPLPGMRVEFANTQALLGPYLSNGLFIVWGGPNDFLAPSPLDTTPQQVITRGVGNLVSIVDGLESLGAKNILVPGMPDIGLTPYFQSLGPADAMAASAATDAFNAALHASLPSGVIYLDTAGLLRSLVANPSAYGFTNVTDACFDGTTVCANPGQYLFWDDFHPTTAADALLAQQFEAAVVPEPSTVILFAGPFIICLIRIRRGGTGFQPAHSAMMWIRRVPVPPLVKVSRPPGRRRSQKSRELTT